MMMIRNNTETAGLYIHIPFCVQKCIYCDFASRAGCTAEEQVDYFDTLYAEISSVKRNPFFSQVLPADTVFIGGGTPTSVPAEYIAGVMERLPLTAGAEVTIEGNPGTLTPEKLKVYRECGINRISLGVQSFNDEELAWLGRIHNAGTACEAVRMCREAGFDNINIDLIFGFPGQTMESWEKTLSTAMSLTPDHVSFYSLQIEEGTPLYEMFRQDLVEQLPDELNRAMYHRAIQVLRDHGMALYEISNAAAPGRECCHNLKYWSMEPYIGLGAAAHSFVNGDRYFNPSEIEKYRALPLEPSSYFNGRERVHNMQEDSRSDFLFTGLRKAEGIDLSEYRTRFGSDLMDERGNVIAGFVMDGLLAEEKGRLHFTEKGLDITNHIIMELM